MGIGGPRKGRGGGGTDAATRNAGPASLPRGRPMPQRLPVDPVALAIAIASLVLSSLVY